jgi:hypothetical protein
MVAPAENIGRRPSSLGGAVGMGLFALIWSSLALVFDGFLGWSAYCQIRAQNYATTTGVVTHSEVERHAGGKNTTYSPNIKYTYTVAGKAYSGDRYRFGTGSSNDSSARRIVDEHPVGKQVPVYYNPDDPAEALLQPGLDGSDLFLAMFLLPFNLVMLAIWSMLAATAWGRLVGSPAGGAKVWDDGFQVRVRLSQVGPFAFGAVVAGLLAFGATFVVGFGFGGFHPPMPVMLVVWPVILAGGLVGYVGYRWKLAQGGSDLVIDATARQVTLPRTMGRTTAVVIPMRQIASVEVQRVEKRGSRGSVSYCYVPTIAFTDASGSTCHEKLVEWWGDARAEALATWLRERLGLSNRGAISGGASLPS